ncbi:MAG: class I SAM-dependent methyltransferase [Candidatus Promineifilaceae bacterium]|nr:class I SAM-dependent methyltransferase [Candidatus Promineifilaceae bacterium]
MGERELHPELSPNYYALWPGYLLRYGGFVLSFATIILGYLSNTQILTALGIVILAITIFLFWAARWVTRRRYAIEQLEVIELLYRMSQAGPEDDLAYVDLGLRAPAIALSRHLTTGQLTVIDVFNPRLTGNKELSNARRQAPSVLVDPRLDWYDSHIDLLPLPDSSVAAVFLPLVLSEFNQEGDRYSLLREIKRILRPGGRLLVAEQNTSWLNWLSLNPGPSKLQPFTHWQNLLTQAGFQLLRQEELHGLSVCMRADKPSPFAGIQLALKLDFQSLS